MRVIMNDRSNNSGLIGTVKAAKEVGISIRQLYHWVDTLEVVNPRISQHGIRRFRKFTVRDLEVLSEVKRLLDRGYTLRAAAEIAKGTRNP